MPAGSRDATDNHGSNEMGKEKDTATVVMDDELVKEIIDGTEDEDGRVVRIDPATREKSGTEQEDEDRG
jgi:hypothetical protein